MSLRIMPSLKDNVNEPVAFDGSLGDALDEMVYVTTPSTKSFCANEEGALSSKIARAERRGRHFIIVTC